MDENRDLRIERNAFGRLVLTAPDGAVHDGVLPVRAFPIAAPDEGVSIVGADGRELHWIERLSALPPAPRALLEAELASREFMPTILQISAVSTFSTPSNWTVETDRGSTSFVLKGEEDIRRLGHGALLIVDSHGIQFLVPDRLALDRRSKKLLERFL